MMLMMLAGNVAACGEQCVQAIL